MSVRQSVSDILESGFSMIFTRDGWVDTVSPMGNSNDILTVIDSYLPDDEVYGFQVRGVIKEMSESEVMVKNSDGDVVMYIVTRWGLDGLEELNF